MQQSTFHALTVGWDHALVETLCDRIAAHGEVRFSHLLHPRYVRTECSDLVQRSDIHFFREHLDQQSTAADAQISWPHWSSQTYRRYTT